MKDLVVIHGNELRCGTWLISEGFERKHAKVLELCKKYEKEMMEFENNKSLSKGFIINKIPKKTAGQPVREFLLNEGQTLFLGTLFRAKSGNDKVLRFKVKLAKDFIKQKKIINSLTKQRQNPEWVKNRAEGKIARRSETDTIKDFVEYATIQGSTHANKYYMLFTKLCNDQMFICNGKFKNKREVMSASQLCEIKFADTIVSKWIINGMAQELPYKEIYQLVKEKIIAFAEIYGKSEIISIKIKKREQLSLIDLGIFHEEI